MSLTEKEKITIMTNRIDSLEKSVEALITKNKAKDSEQESKILEILGRKVKQDANSAVNAAIAKLKEEMQLEIDIYAQEILGTEKVLEKYEFNIQQFNRISTNIKFASKLYEKLSDKETAISQLIGNT